jgi:hypothetical protein
MKFNQENIQRLGLTKSKKGTWIKKSGGPSYYYMDSCKVCGSPYLGQKRNGKIDETCCYECSVTLRVGVKRPDVGEKLKGIVRSEKTKEKIRKAMIGHKITDSTRKKISDTLNSYNSIGLAAYDTYAHQIAFADDIRRNGQDPNVLEARCAYCGKWFVPSVGAVRLRRDALVGNSHGEGRLYCSEECKHECPIFYQMKYPKGVKPSTAREAQPALRQMVFERDGWLCQRCGKTDSLHCHHITGVKQNPIESADIDNCITLCKECHKKAHSTKGCWYSDLKCA